MVTYGANTTWGLMMPGKGFKSITVREDVYDYFYQQWERLTSEHKMQQGYTSFSGFVSKLLYDLIQREKQRVPPP